MRRFLEFQRELLPLLDHIMSPSFVGLRLTTSEKTLTPSILKTSNFTLLVY